MIVELVVVGSVSLGAWLVAKLLVRPVRPTPDPTHHKLRDAARALKSGTATAEQLREAAQVAELAGDYELAERFGSRALVYAGVEEARREAVRTSPLDGVTDDAWRRFVAAARLPDTDADYVSPRFRLGLYGLDARLLADLGVMRRLRRGEWQGHEVWLADWASQSEGWLEDAEQQYTALAKLSQMHAATIRTKHATALGVELEPGQPASLSGLLAVARLAGLGGLNRFIHAPDERLPNTLRAYRASNGLF